MKNLEGKRIAILTEDGFEKVELTSPKEALEAAGAKVDIISPQSQKVRSKTGDEWGESLNVDITLSNADPNEYHGLVIPGGVINPDKLRVNEAALNFIKSFSNAGKHIASICHGPQVLIDSELVAGKKMTSVAAIKKDLINAQAQWEDTEVVTDGGLTTSRTPDDLPAFNQRIIEQFGNA